MQQKIIYLIRHAETEFNKKGVVQGSGIDAPLNDYGQAQAEAFYQYYQHVAFDKVYTSTLIRTIQTVNGFLEKGYAHESYDGLNEISWGVREGKIPHYSDNDYYRWLTQSWKDGQIDLPAEGGESPVDVQNRQKPIIDLILSRPEEATILICMHGRAMRVLLTTIFDLPLHQMDDFLHHNTCLYLLHYDYTTNTFKIDKNNDISHLSTL